MVILLDVGHAESTKGKRMRKDDGTYFFEYKSNREIGKLIYDGCKKLGIECIYVVDPEEKKDIPISTRAAIANKLCAKYGISNCLYVSVHSNACGDGKTWNKAKGWCIYTTKGETKSDKYATIFYEEAEKLLPKYGMTLRKDMKDGDPDYEENFTVIYKTKCPAVLTENLFFTNCCELTFLESEIGKKVIADIHLNAIKRICEM